MTAKEKNSINRILIISLFIAVAASFLGLYPLYKRIQIYLIPVFIIFILKVCDIKKIKQQYLLVLFSIILLNFAPILNLKYMEQINSKDVFEKWNGRETLKVIQDNFKDGDTLLVNYQSKSQYEYYSKYLNFNPENIIIYDFSNKTKDEFFDYLNNLENNKDYWFLNIITSFDNQERDYLIDWKSNTKNVITKYEYIIRRSYVVKIEKKC